MAKIIIKFCDNKLSHLNKNIISNQLTKIIVLISRYSYFFNLIIPDRSLVDI